MDIAGTEDGGGASPAPATFDGLMERIRGVFAGFHDRRTGRNTRYSMLDAALGAFAVFFTQSPSFLAHQSAMQKARGQSNARTLFLMDKVPTDAHIRTLLDAVPAESVFPALDTVLEVMESEGLLVAFRGFRNSRLIALDGTQTHHSEKIYCAKCTVREHANGRTDYSHTALTPVDMVEEVREWCRHYRAVKAQIKGVCECCEELIRMYVKDKQARAGKKRTIKQP